MTDEETEAEMLVDDLNGYLHERFLELERQAYEDVNEIMLIAYYRYIRPYERLRGFSFFPTETTVCLPSDRQGNEDRADLDRVAAELPDLAAMALLWSERGSRARLQTNDNRLVRLLHRHLDVSAAAVLGRALLRLETQEAKRREKT